MRNIFKRKPKEPTIHTTTISKVYIMAITHQHYNKFAVLKYGKANIMHCVHDGYDWLVIDTLTLKPSCTGLLLPSDILQSRYISNLDTLLNSPNVSTGHYEYTEGLAYEAIHINYVR